MLTALIAEDELLVKIGISSCVPWAELNVAVVGEASDGTEAWELFQKYRPGHHHSRPAHAWPERHRAAAEDPRG